MPEGIYEVRVWGVGLRVKDLGLGLGVSRFRVEGLGFSIQGSGFRV